MIIVTGSAQVRAEAIDEALRLSLEHVHRSRTEPGCLLHSVHRDVEAPEDQPVNFPDGSSAYKVRKEMVETCYCMPKPKK